MTEGGQLTRKLYLLIATALIALSACRRKDSEAASVAGHAAASSVRYLTGDAAVSDGILAGLQRELDNARKVNSSGVERVKAVRPVLDCVEAISATEWRAHFGYVNSGDT